MVLSMHRTFYGDESGSITTSKGFKNRYFIIGFISLIDKNEKDKVKRVFRKSKKDFIKYNPHLNLDITKEIKGSEMPLEMKKYVFEKLISKTNIKFHYAIIDNHKLYGKLQSKPHITFNYLIDTYFKDNHRTGIKDLHLNLDDRNKAVEKLRDLENYLQTSLFVTTDIENVKVEYFESHKVDLIQLSDVFCNFLYSYVTFYMNAKNTKSLKIKGEYLDVFNLVKNNIECYTSFPKYRSSFICPH